MSLNQLYLDKLAIRLQAWDAELRRWSHQAEFSSAERHRLLARELRLCYGKRDQVQERLAELYAAPCAAWHVLKTGLEMAWCDFTQSIERAATVFDA